jgi:hypothetical protein
MKSEFKRLIRFEDSEGQIFFGEAPGVGKDENLVGKRVQIYSGTQPWLLSPAGEEREISKVCGSTNLFQMIPNRLKPDNADFVSYPASTHYIWCGVEL